MAKEKKKKRRIRFHRQLMSKKILKLILDDFSFFGSIPFYVFITLLAYFTGYQTLFFRLAYCLLISFVVVIAIKKIHYRDRPQKEEFDIFMEKVLAASFPSSHSLAVTVLSILLWVSFPYRWVMTGAIIISMLVLMQRYISKKHFFIDIIGGILIGIIECIYVIRVV
jgi:membrane-associated phospholipid phosphatase